MTVQEAVSELIAKAVAKETASLRKRLASMKSQRDVHAANLKIARGHIKRYQKDLAELRTTIRKGTT